jgi:hypothetical protein
MAVARDSWPRTLRDAVRVSNRLTMPTSLRTKTDPMGGNRVTLMRFDVAGRRTRPGKTDQGHTRAHKFRTS